MWNKKIVRDISVLVAIFMRQVFGRDYARTTKGKIFNGGVADVELIQGLRHKKQKPDPNWTVEARGNEFHSIEPFRERSYLTSIERLRRGEMANFIQSNLSENDMSMLG